MTIRHIPAVDTPYAHIINTANSQWWNTDTAAFEVYDAGNLADYAVTAGTQFGTTGIWPWTFPSAIAAGQYTVLVYDGDDDSLIEAGVVDWTGSALKVNPDLGTNAPANWINAAAIAASALNGKGDWNVGKTGYALASNGLNLITSWVVAITGNITGNLSGSVGSVTAAVETDSASRMASKATAGEIRTAIGLGSANLDAQLSDIDTAADVSAGILATLTENVSGLRFTEKALEEAPTGSGGGGDDAATIYSYFADGSRPDIFKADVSGLAEKTDLPTNFAAMGINASGHVSRVVLVDTTTANTDMRGTDSAYTGTPPTQAEIYTYFADGTRPNIFKADVSGLSTYDGSDTAGTTTLLSRLTGDRATYLDKLNVTGTLANTDNAGSFQADVAGLSTYDGSDTSGTTTLLSRLSASRAGYLDKLNVSGVIAHTDNASSFMADVSAIPNVTAFEARTLPTADYATLAGQGLIADAIDELVEPPDEETIAAAVLGFDVTTIEDAAVLYSLATTIMQKLNATVVGSNLRIRKSDGSLMHERQFTSDSNAEPVTGIGDVS